MWVKSTFFVFDHVIITYSLKKNIRKFRFWSNHFFEDVPLLSISRNSLQTPSLDDIFLRNWTLSNSIILLEDLIRWNRRFAIFLIGHYAGDMRNKNIAAKYWKTFVSVLGGSAHTGCYIYNSYNICIIYLHIIEASLKVNVAMF